MQWETLPHRDGSGRGSLRPRYDAGQAGGGAKVSKSGLATQPNHDGQDTLFGMIVAVFLEGRADRSKPTPKVRTFFTNCAAVQDMQDAQANVTPSRLRNFPKDLIRKVR